LIREKKINSEEKREGREDEPLEALVELQVREGIGERAAHQELEGEVVDALDALLVKEQLGIFPPLDKAVANAKKLANQKSIIGEEVHQEASGT